MSYAEEYQRTLNLIETMETTRTQIKTAVNTDFEAINNEQIEQYPNLIRNAINQYKSYIPVVTGEGKQVSLNTVPLKPKEFALIGDTFQQQYEGYQLFDKNNYNIKSLNATAYAGETGTYGLATNQKHIYIPCKANTDYVVIKDVSTITNLGIYATDDIPAVGGSYTTLYYTSNSTGKVHVTTTASAKYLGIRINGSSAITQEQIDNIAETLLIAEGTNVDIPYEPYVGGTPAPNPKYRQPIKVVTGEQIVVKRGKNLFNKNNPNKLDGAYININNNTLASSANARIVYIPIKENQTYTVSKKVTEYSYFRIGTTKELPSVGSNVYDIQNGSGSQTYLTLTSSAESKYLVVWWGRVDYDDETSVLNSIQIEEGSTATTYESYITPVELPLNLGNMELCKIEDYKDILFKNKQGSKYYNAELEENAWYKKNEIGQIVFDETSTWTLQTNIGNLGITRFRTENKITNALNEHSREPIISNYFFDISNSGSHKIGGSFFANQYLYFYFGYDGVTLNDFTTWLGTHNTAVYYILSEPTYTKITDETLISQLEAINNTNMNNGTTIIYAENEEGLQPTLYVGAYKKEAV